MWAVYLLVIIAVLGIVDKVMSCQEPKRAALFLASCAFAFVLFVLFIEWNKAVIREEAIITHRIPPHRIPVAWEVVTINFGKPREWTWGTKSDNPVGFGLCTASFIAITCYVNWTLFTCRTGE